jgi:hypothetical protein
MTMHEIVNNDTEKMTLKNEATIREETQSRNP